MRSSTISRSALALTLPLLQISLSASFNVAGLNPSQRLASRALHVSSDAIDVEFTKSDDEENKVPQTFQASAGASSPQQTQQSTLQASLNMVPPHLQIPIEFTDPISKSFIPCNMAFVLNHNGEEYTIGTPIHTQVAVYCEDNGQGRSYFVDPDLDDNLELMEMAAARFESENQCKIIFQRTPRTLTIQNEAELDKLIKGWKATKERHIADEVRGVLEETDEEADDAFFEAFFEKELGKNYREEFLLDDPELDAEAQELMELFNVPGLGTEKDDEEGLQGLLEEIVDDNKKSKQDDRITNEEDEAALRLVGFEGPDGKPYSLVKMLQPMILVARNDENLAPDQRFLLTPEEADQIMPMLEKEFREELDTAGLSFGPHYE